MREPKVSIIVPVYNGEKFIKNTLQILMNSSLYEIEIVVIDDDSKDSSLHICNEAAAKDQRIKVYHQDNTGVFGARNHGLQMAKGEFICFCDQDDVIESTAYEKMFLTAKKHDCEVVMTSTGKLIGEKKENFENFPDAVFKDAEIRDNCMLPILFNGTNYCSTGNEIRMENDIWKCMIKRSFIVENNLVFRHFVNYEDDFLFLLDTLARASKVATLSEVLYYWRINLKSETYTTAYVDGLYAKDISLQNEIMNIMRMAGIDNSCVELYGKCQNCNRYIHMVENEGRNKIQKHNQKIKAIRKLQKEPEFKECLKMRSSYKRNLIHRKIILAMMEKHLFAGAYFFHKMYVWVRKIGLRCQLWTKVETFLYSKG